MDFVNNRITDLNHSGTQRVGEQGRCYTGDGIDDYVYTGTSGASISGKPATIMAWVKISSSRAGFSYPFGAWGSSAIRVFCIMTGITANQIWVAYDNATPINFTFAGLEDSWHHVAATFDGANLNLYIDGVLRNQGSDTEMANTSFDVAFLGRNNGANVCQCEIFDVRYYSDPLTQDNINYVYTFGQSGVDPTNSSLLAQYKCDEQSGTTAYDVSGNGNNGTLTNITSGTFHNTQDIWSFQNQLGFNKRMYFDGVDDYVSISGMSSSTNYFGACTISAKVYIADPSKSQIICSLSDSAYRIYTAGGTWRVNSKNTVSNVSLGYNRILVDFDSSGNAISFTVNGAEIWTGVAAAGAASDDVFRIGTQKTLTAYFNGIIYDFSITGSSVKNFSFNGYGNTDADWIDQIGSNNGTVNGSPSNIYLPRNESNKRKDVLGNDLTYTGKRPNDAALHSSNCLTLNGTNQAVRVTDNTALDITDNLTVCVWAKHTSSPTPSVSDYLIGKYDYGALDREWAIGIDYNSKIEFIIGSNNGTTANEWTSTNALTSDQWNHIAFTFESGTLKVYLNGIEVLGSFNVGSSPATLHNGSADLMIGTILNSDTRVLLWDGQIFDARIYAGDSTVLTAAQIQSIYADGSSNVQFAGQSLRAHYKLAEGGGTQCLDASGNENHGTIENAATNWSVTQDLVHSNLSDGFVYAYQPAKQVFTGAQAVNITGISFKFRSTDTRLAVLDSAGAFPYFLYIFQGSSSTDLFHTSVTGTITVIIDGSTEWGTTRGDLFSALCDGEVHEVSVTGFAFTGGWLTNGIFVNSWSGGEVWDSTTYLWDLQATDSNGDPIYPADPDVRLPAVNSTTGPYSITLTDPSGSYLNRCETKINFNPDSTPEMSNFGDYTIPTNYGYGNTLDVSGSQAFKRSTNNKEDRFLFYKEPVSGEDLETVITYISESRS